ncbi:MAG: hypothetical protein HPZ79_02650 [Oscillospiraceae bacterium]|nr:hypothetical protein [Oscillospiraceae bacterium]
MGHPTGKKNRYYSKDEKIRIAKGTLAGKSGKEVSDETGIGSQLIRSRVPLYLGQGENSLENKRMPAILYAGMQTNQQ